MFTKTYERNVPAGTTGVSPALPGVERASSVRAIDLTDSSRAVGMTRVAGPDSGGLSVVAAPYDRRIAFTITQDEPLSAVQGSVPDWATGKHYFKGEVVFFQGRQYRAKREIAAGTGSFVAANWENLSGDTGEIKLVVGTAPVGSWPCDGSMVNAPWSPLHGTVTPDLRGELLSVIGVKGAAGTDALRSTRSTPGPTPASFIATQHLPKSSIPVSVSTTIAERSAGTPGGTFRFSGTTNEAGAHSHGFGRPSGWGNLEDAPVNTVSNVATKLRTSTDGGHSHPFSGNGVLDGIALPTHGHNASSSGSVTLNQNSTPVLPYFPPSFALTAVIRL